MTGVHAPWVPSVGDVVEVRFNRGDARRAPWWSSWFFVSEVLEAQIGVVVVAYEADDDFHRHPWVFVPGHDHLLRPAGQTEGQLSLLETQP